VLLVSDEDMVVLESLEPLLAILRNQDGRLAFLRTSIPTFQFGDACFPCGHNAVVKGTLENNYLTGIVYNTRMYEAAEVSAYIRAHADNEICRVYPHMVIDILLSQYGDAVFSSLCSCSVGVDENDASSADLTRYRSTRDIWLFILTLFANIASARSRRSKYYLP